MATQAERLAAIEERMNAADRSSAESRHAQAEAMKAMDAKIAAVDAKLDDLIALRNRGVGAFWLATALLGTGIWGAISAAWNWITHIK